MDWVYRPIAIGASDGCFGHLLGDAFIAPRARRDTGIGVAAAVAESVRVVAGFVDAAVAGQTVEPRGGELGVDEHVGPSRKHQVRMVMVLVCS